MNSTRRPNLQLSLGHFLALERKGWISRSALITVFTRRGFRRQFPPQFEGDLGQARVGLGDRS